MVFHKNQLKQGLFVKQLGFMDLERVNRFANTYKCDDIFIVKHYYFVALLRCDIKDGVACFIIKFKVIQFTLILFGVLLIHLVFSFG